jgi:hypothetical protein
MALAADHEFIGMAGEANDLEHHLGTVLRALL